MKLRVTKCVKPWNEGRWKIEKHSLFFGWEDFGGLTFKSYEDAATYAKDFRLMNG